MAVKGTLPAANGNVTYSIHSEMRNCQKNGVTMKKNELLQQLDNYQKGLLSEEEIDRLWVEILENPEYLDWLEIDVNARAHYEKLKKDKNRKSGDS